MLLRNRPARFSIKKVQSIYEKFSKPMGWSDWQRSSSPSVEEISKPPAGRSEYDDDAIRKRRRLDSLIAGSLVSVFLLMLLYARNDRLMVDHDNGGKRKIEDWAEEFTK